MSEIRIGGNISNTKECPVCGKKYSKDHNFCSEHSDAVKLVYSDELVKICPKCNMKYTRDANYCGIHDIPIELAYIKDLTKQCKACGSKYPDSYNYCIKCEWDEPLEVIGEITIPRNVKVRDIRFSPNSTFNKSRKNSFDDLPSLLSDENIEKLKDFSISQIAFDRIIADIINTHKKNLKYLVERYDLDISGMHIVDKMILFSKSFVKTEYKVIGGDLGHFEFNRIYIDERLENAQQITTIIHELSHFLLSEILEQVTAYMLECEKSDVLEAFVYYTLVKNDFNALMDEYCAHTVEGRYAVFGYQDYGSFDMMVDDFSKNHGSEVVEVAMILGNTFAEYIKSVMNSFIKMDIWDEIKKEYRTFSDDKDYTGVFREIETYFEWDEFSQALKLVLTRNIDEFAFENHHIRGLFAYSLRFKEENND